MVKENETSLIDYLFIIKKRWKFILLFTLIVLILIFNISLLWPKTYESESVIQLGSIRVIQLGSISEGGERKFEEIYSPAEAKNIILSSSVLIPVINNFFPDEELELSKFTKKNLEVKIITERAVISDVDKTSFISIKVKTRNAEKAKEINNAIINNFLNYTKEEYEKRVELLEKELEEVGRDIEEIRRELDSSLKATEDYKILLLKYIEEQNRKRSIEGKLVTKREFMIISEPQIPFKPTSPKLWLNLIIAFILSLLSSTVLIISKEKSKV